MTIVYDGDGNRVSKTVAGVTTTYLVDTLNPTGYAQVLAESFAGASGAQELSHNYVYGLELISQARHYFTGTQSLTQTIYYVYDGHGSVRALTSPTGAITDTYDYDAFGNLIHSSTTLASPTPNNYLFAGEQFDPDLNLYYNRARYLNVSTGRFWTPDSIEGLDFEPQSLHRYLYASSDPVGHVDPSGHEDADIASNTFSTVGLVVIASLAVITLAVECVVYADVTGGEGPCGNQNRPQGRMRIQLQLADTFTAPGTPVLSNPDPPGVTILQLRAGLGALYAIAKTAAARFPFNRLESDLVTAVVTVSQQAGLFVPLGYTGPKRSLLSAPIGYSGWRIDVDNLTGTNLRQ